VIVLLLHQFNGSSMILPVFLTMINYMTDELRISGSQHLAFVRHAYAGKSS
jgi:hypothetical protein